MNEFINLPDDEEEQKPEPVVDIPDSSMEPILPEPDLSEGAAADKLPEEALLILPDDEHNGLIEGQFEEVPPEDIIQIEEPKKPKTKPAIFALFTILALIALCCLMSIIIFFMVRPAMLESNTVGALFPTMKDLLSIFR